MVAGYRFAAYQAGQREACLGLFDTNCPAFFAPNERADYDAFLARVGSAYRVCLVGEQLVGAFGVIAGAASDRRRLSWILIAPDAQGGGIGRAMVAEAVAIAHAAGAGWLDIAASQHSAPFFARLGAHDLGRIEHGWGKGMHRIDMELPL